MNAWTKIERDEALLREQSRFANQAHLRFAPPAVRQRLDLMTDRVVRRDRSGFDEDAAVLQIELEKCEAALLESLQRTDPRAARQLLFGEQTGEFEMPDGGDTVSRGRAAWILGTFGNGERAGQYAALVFFNKYVRWHATTLALGQARFLQDKMAGTAQPLAERVVVSRLLGTQTRMRWVTDELCGVIGAWVDRNLPKEHSSFGTEQMERIAHNVSRAVRLAPAELGGDRRFSDALLDGVSSDLIDSLSMQRTPLTMPRLKSALESEEHQLRPIVLLDGNPSVLDPGAWMLHRETALIHVLMDRSPRDQQGDLLEEVCVEALNRWGPTDLHWESSKTLKLAGRSASDELDLIAISRDRAFIGECKSNRLPRKNESLDATFAEKILQGAAGQVRLRIEHWTEGWRPVGQPDVQAEATGMIVSLSDYGGAVWQSDLLGADEDAAPIEVGVFPLHSLLLLVSVLRSGKDLSTYLAWRSELLAAGLNTFDELEPILADIHGTNSSPLQTSDGIVMMFQAYELDQAAVIDLDPAQSGPIERWKEDWRRALSNASVPVGPRLAEFT